MTSDFNDRGGSEPPRPNDQAGTMSGTSFGSGGRGLPGDGTPGQGSTTKLGGSGGPGAYDSEAESRASKAEPADESSSARASLHDDRNRFGDAVRREASDAKDAVRSAADGIRNESAGLASEAKQRLEEQAEGGLRQASSGLGDFASAVRKASDELGQRDQSLAAGMMREVASGIEQAANTIKGSSIQELGQSVAGFARRQPTAFMLGAALAGIALGRVARASSGHGRQQSAYPQADRTADAGQPYLSGSSPAASSPFGDESFEAAPAVGAGRPANDDPDTMLPPAAPRAEPTGDARLGSPATQPFGDRFDER